MFAGLDGIAIQERGIIEYGLDAIQHGVLPGVALALLDSMRRTAEAGS